MAEIARVLGLSPATVSRVLNGKGHGFISPDTRRRVIDCAREKGFPIPDSVQQSPADRSAIVALWSRNPDAPYYARIIRRMQELAAGFGVDLVLVPVVDRSGESGSGPPARRPVPQQFSTSAIIAVDCAAHVRAYVENSTDQVPIINVGSEPCDRTDSVTFHPLAGAEEATRHLLAAGCRRIAHLTANGSIPSIRQARLAGYQLALNAAGMEPLILVAPAEDRNSARLAVRAALDRGETFDAVFCLNDDLAIGAYRGLLDAKLRVPEDVLVVGYDSLEDTEFLEVSISSVLQSHEELCNRTWELLWRRIEDRAAPRISEVLMPRLVIRESSNFLVQDRGTGVS